MVALSQVALIASGVSPDKPRRDPVRFVQIRDLAGARRDLTVGDRPLVSRALPIQAGDVLIAARGERTLAAEADADLFDAYATLDLYLIRPDVARLDPSFLLAVLLLPQTGARLRASTAGASLPRIARNDIADLEVPDLPLDRQRSIGRLAHAHRTYRELLVRLAERHAAAADLQILEALGASKRKRRLMPTIDDIKNAVWSACDTFRGTIDATQYKDYILALLFLKYISDIWKKHYDEFAEEYRDDPADVRELRIRRKLERERFKLKEVEVRNSKGEVTDTFLSSFDSLFERRANDNIGELINIALDGIEQANDPKLKGVFRNIDFNSEANLGQTKDRNRRLEALLKDFGKAALDLRHVKEDIIGEAYIYLIERFHSDAGKKAGEFFTPRRVSELVAKLAAPKDGARICDPACGSGALLLRAGEEVGSKNFRLYGQESNGQTRALARMNMFLHGQDSARIEWGDTLNNPLLLEGDHLMRFDVVVANPPFSLDKWVGDGVKADAHRRFTRGLPPQTKADYAFILHMIAVARPGEGRVAVVAPHGVLFRGGAEGRIRESLVRDNLLDAVVGLPAQLFPTTGIPVCIMVFDRAREPGGLREHEKDVLFIDASRGFTPGKKQNQLDDDHLAAIADTYRNRTEVPKYSHKALPAEIASNGFNLNIPRYVDTFEPEAEIDLKTVQQEIKAIEQDLASTRAIIDTCLADLGVHV